MSITNYLGEIAAIVGAFCFGVGNVLIKSQGNKITPFAINAIRLTLSAIIYIIIVASMGIISSTFNLTWEVALYLAGGTFIGVVVGDIIFFFSQQLIGLSRAYPIAVSYPLMTYILGLIIGSEYFHWARIAGVVLVIGGVYLVSISTNANEIRNQNPAEETSIEKTEDLEKTSDESLSENEEEHIEDTEKHTKEKEKEEVLREETQKFKLKKKHLFLGIGGAVTTAICWTIGTVLMDQAFNDQSLEGLPATAFRIVCVTPISLLIFASSNRGKYKSKFSWKGVLFVILAGLIGNTAGGLLYAFALQFSTASTTAAITAAAPLIATPLSVIFLKEKISWKLVVGTIITMAGIWLIILF
ncbi:MAG: DMT family transporter [Candidatus Heimdallarchaeota archaeon]